jgi:hypothetical protein
MRLFFMGDGRRRFRFSVWRESGRGERERERGRSECGKKGMNLTAIIPQEKWWWLLYCRRTSTAAYVPSKKVRKNEENIK